MLTYLTVKNQRAFHVLLKQQLMINSNVVYVGRRLIRVILSLIGSPESKKDTWHKTYS